MAEPATPEPASSGRPARAGRLTVPLLLALLGFGLADGLARLGWLALRQWQQPVLVQDSWLLLNHYGLGWPAWLFHQHNEHRIVFARLATVVETQILGVPAASTALLQTFLLTLASIGLLGLICRSSLGDRRLASLTWLSGSLLLINPWQWENFSWEFQTPWILINLLVLLATWMLGRRRGPDGSRPGAMEAVAIALLPWLAIFTSGQGMALSLSLCFVTLRLGRGFWMPCFGSSLLAFGAYFLLLPYARPAAHPHIHFSGEYFSAVLLGGAWPGLRLLLAAFLLLLLILGRCRGALLQEVIQARPELLIPALFSLFFALMTTLSRSAFGPGQASASRYVTHSLMLALSLLLIASVLIERRWPTARSGLGARQQRLAPALVVIASLLLPPPWAAPGRAYLNNWDRAWSTYQSKNLVFRCLAKAAAGSARPADPGDMATLYFRGALEAHPTGWHRLLITPPGLEQLRLKGAEPSLRYSLSSVAAVPDGYALRGWALDPADLCNQLMVVATYADGRRWAGSVAELRPDIQARLGIVSPMVGFDLTVPASFDGAALASLRLGGKGKPVDLLPLLKARLGREFP